MVHVMDIILKNLKKSSEEDNLYLMEAYAKLQRGPSLPSPLR